MKTLFKEKNNTTLVLAIAGGTVAAGTLAYLYLTESGASARAGIFHKIKNEAKNLAAGIISNKTGIHKQAVKRVADHVVK